MSYKNQYIHPKVRPKLSGTPEEMIRQFVDFWANHEESVGKNLTREFQTLQMSPGGTTIINRGGISSGGGGGGSSKKQTLHIQQTVAAAGTIPVSFIDVTTNQYGILAYILKSNGDYSFAIPNLPPRTDSRTTNSCTIDVAESGELHTFIILD